MHTHLNKADFYGRIAAKHFHIPLIFSTCHNYSTTHTSADINKKSIFDRIDDMVINYSDSSLIAISKLVYQIFGTNLIINTVIRKSRNTFTIL